MKRSTTVYFLICVFTGQETHIHLIVWCPRTDTLTPHSELKSHMFKFHKYTYISIYIHLSFMYIYVSIHVFKYVCTCTFNTNVQSWRVCIYIYTYLFIYTRFLCRCKCTFEHTRRRLVGHPARPSPAFSIGTTLGFVPWRMWHNTTGRSLSQCCLPKLEMARKREREREREKKKNG